MRKKKFLIGIIPVFLVGILLCNKPIKRIIEVKSNSYGAPANSAFTDENLYFGYWSFELGALIKIKGLNNESLKDINYYPYDLVEFKD